MIFEFIKKTFFRVFGELSFDDFPCAVTDKFGSVVRSNEMFKRYISDELGIKLGDLGPIRTVDGVASCTVNARCWVIKHKKLFTNRYQIILVPKITEFPEISPIVELPMVFIDATGIIKYCNRVAIDKFRFRSKDYLSKYCSDFTTSMLSTGINIDLDFMNVKCRVSFYEGPNDLWLLCIRDAKDSRSIDRSRDQMTFSIVHDFRNILSLIDTQCQMFLEAGGRGKEISQIRETVFSASDMIKDILKVNKAKVESCCLYDLLASMEDVIKKLVGNAINVNFSLDEKMGRAMISEVDLERIIVNMVINAKDSIKDSGTIGITLFKKYFNEAWSINGFQMMSGFYLVMRFEDTGCGISPENMRRIFEPMFTTKENGSGLGLSAIMSILRDAGGGIEVFSKIDKGSRFDLYMPLIQNIGQQKTKKRILMVEDNRQFLDMCSTILHKDGYEVKKFLNAEDALLFLKKNPIDLLITDANLPGASGADLAHRAQIGKVLVISGYDESLLKKKFPPGTIFMAKPIRMEDLREKTRTLLGL